ncbi:MULTISPECIES: Nramp family divalent metal transporter [Alphaproteobacteria]|uniref:Divalent metal cation transporter MntH n=2 Tax=Alphaproteobacteria TaxID=28211 RepID=A0A512HHZ9_9HYPH|nr:MULTISPECIES: Nramp family divalent metal transporter [Alphaproteobacteria]GEO85067.1 divalent metal cation transporter MntH [Ciceribacter naphthalenivorans]GLR24599.1 divalent metal cation transporter MntH [Ciceribacter naphthalenivorans]GLT07455.1 divalent metal cation transporter MntH [Sphingomonas psychrolutea]
MAEAQDKSRTSPGWTRERGEPSLSDVHASISVKSTSPYWRRALAFLGPGYLVAVGYMDPGNWATSLAGGSRFGYALLVAILISSLMAILLQSLAARLAIASGRDLAQACRDSYPMPVNIILWLLAEIAIVATDVAEVIGTAIGIQLIFGIPLEIGVLITAADVFIILLLQRLGFRWVEAFVITLTVIIAASFAIQLTLAGPDWGGVAAGFLPSAQIVLDPEMLYIAIGIIGATVMPHNLYLHSGIIQTRQVHTGIKAKREALTFATFDSTLALFFAFLVNASILILAAAAFHGSGHQDVAELGDAHALLSPLLGSTAAPILFGVALLCSGLNSTATATLAGQIVMEGFVNLRVSPWIRRLITRGLAIIPAAVVTIWFGERGTAELLILSQVVLSLQLPFAVIPLVTMTASRAKMGALVSPRWLSGLATLIAVVIILLNMKLVIDFIAG